MHRQFNEDLFEHTKMTFGEHLDELRRALVKAVLALVIGFGIGLLFGQQLVAYIQKPLRQALRDHYNTVDAMQYRKLLERRRADGKPVPADIDTAVDEFLQQGLVPEERYLDPQQLIEALKEGFPHVPGLANVPRVENDTGLIHRDKLIRIQIYHDLDQDPRLNLVGLGSEEPFVAYMKAAIVLGAVLSSPFVFYFMWQFVAAGLYPHEQKYVHVFLPFSVLLFLAGAALAFFFAFKYVLAFLLWFYEAMQIDPQLRISDWLTFVLILPLGFGISFQLPLVMLFLERIGIFSVATYLSNWKISVLVIFFIAMVLTPSDPYSMMLMATPLVGLYFFGIMLCKWMPRRTSPFGEALD